MLVHGQATIPFGEIITSIKLCSYYFINIVRQKRLYPSVPEPILAKTPTLHLHQTSLNL